MSTSRYLSFCRILLMQSLMFSLLIICAVILLLHSRIARLGRGGGRELRFFVNDIPELRRSLVDISSKTARLLIIGKYGILLATTGLISIFSECLK